MGQVLTAAEALSHSSGQWAAWLHHQEDLPGMPGLLGCHVESEQARRVVCQQGANRSLDWPRSIWESIDQT